MVDSKPQQQARFREAFSGATPQERRLAAQKAAYAAMGFKVKKVHREWS